MARRSSPRRRQFPKLLESPGRPVARLLNPREWIKCSGIKTPQIQNYGRRTFLSKKVSYLVRGHAHEHATRSIPEINLKDNSFDYAAVAKWIQRRYDWNCTQYTLLQATSTSNRFEVYVEYAPAGQQWNGLSFMPLRIRAFTGHNDWVTEASGFDNIPGDPIAMDVNYTIEHAKKGVRPGFCKDFSDARRKALPKIAYHMCNMQNFFDIIYMGIFPGGMGDRQTSRGHAYLTIVPPWDRHGRKAGGARADRPINIAVDVEMLIQLGCRLYAPGDGEALVTEDWITNKVLIYAYDAECAKFIWSNRMYVSVRRNYQDSIKKYREETQKGVVGRNRSWRRPRRSVSSITNSGPPRHDAAPPHWQCDEGQGRLRREPPERRAGRA